MTHTLLKRWATNVTAGAVAAAAVAALAACDDSDSSNTPDASGKAAADGSDVPDAEGKCEALASAAKRVPAWSTDRSVSKVMNEGSADGLVHCAYWQSGSPDGPDWDPEGAFLYAVFDAGSVEEAADTLDGAINSSKVVTLSMDDSYTLPEPISVGRAKIFQASPIGGGARGELLVEDTVLGGPVTIVEMTSCESCTRELDDLRLFAEALDEALG